MFLYPVLDELAPRQEDWPEFPIAGFAQADAAEHFSTSMSPKGFQEASDDFVSQVGSRRFSLNNRNQERTRIGCQEHVEEIFCQGVLAVIHPGDRLHTIQQMGLPPQLAAHLGLTNAGWEEGSHSEGGVM